MPPNDGIDEKDLPDSGLLDLVKPKKFGMSFTPQPAVEPESQDATAQQPAQPAQSSQPEVIEYSKPDGSIGQEELPVDPIERKKKIAELASGRDAYLAGREIVKEKAPELSDEWRSLLKGQQEILSKMADAQAQVQQNQKVDPVDLLTDDQREYYQIHVDEGDERKANAYLKACLNQNMMIFDTQKKNEETERKMLEQRVNNRAMEFRQLDSSLPNPSRGGKDAQAFTQKFQDGYGGYLQNLGFSPEQIWFSDNIDHETLYNAYLTKTGQSKQNKETTQPQTPVKTVDVAKATIAPAVAKSIQDVSRGSVSASIGGEDDFARYRNVRGRGAIRALDQQDGGKFSEKLLEETGIARFLTKRKK